MNIINLVNAVDPVSIGVWKAAIWTAPTLLADHQIDTHLWSNLASDWKAEDHSITSAQDIGRLSRRMLREQFLSRFSPADTIVVSHGAWKFPTTWGADFARLGFPWIYVPQGMLEPWSLKQRAVRKRLYWRAVEGRCVRSAAVVRAVSSTEQENLQKLLPDADVRLIPNGIESVTDDESPQQKKTTFLFLGRLHQKKGVTELARAFCGLPQASGPNVELVIAGPDQGELTAIRSLQVRFPKVNLRYVGPVHGHEKARLLKAAQFFVLPSHSEGFPTSVVEAMGAGCVPVISDGCNFPEAKRNGVCVHVDTTVDSIRTGILKALQMPSALRSETSAAARSFISHHYTAKPIAAMQAALFKELTQSTAAAVSRAA